MSIKMFLLTIAFLSQLTAQQFDTTGRATYFLYFIPSNLEFEFQNWEQNKYTFPVGIYYQFEGIIEHKEGKKQVTSWTVINKPEMIIGFLLGKGVLIKEVWYKESESNCHGTQMIVSASLLIRTANETNEKLMNSFGFERTEDLRPGSCPYNIRHYVFK